MYVISAHQTDRRTDGRTSSDGMTAPLLKHVAVKIKGLQEIHRRLTCQHVVQLNCCTVRLVAQEVMVNG